MFGLKRPTPLRYCDVPGCGAAATIRSTGAETDPRGLARAAIAKLNVCEHHRDWVFSEDAAAAMAGSPDVYNSRK